MTEFPLFDRTSLSIRPLSDREHDLDISIIKDLNLEGGSEVDVKFRSIAEKIVNAKKNDSSIILMLGGHVIRAGVQKYIIDMMENGLVSCLALNGACMIHDYELSLIGATTESVAKYIKEGQFGLWKETGQINDHINWGYAKGLGMGEAVGQAISEGDFPYKDTSLLAAGYRLNIPVTVHVGLGYDIIHEHPNCDGAATGATSYRDFLYFAKVVENMEDGVVMNFGSAVMAPEVFLKALSMARNVAHGNGRYIDHFTTLVCDLRDIPENFHDGPHKKNPAYYFRPWKTLLVRTVADGGQSYYIKGDHANTVPALWRALTKHESD